MQPYGMPLVPALHCPDLPCSALCVQAFLLFLFWAMIGCLLATVLLIKPTIDMFNTRLSPVRWEQRQAAAAMRPGRARACKEVPPPLPHTCSTCAAQPCHHTDIRTCVC